MGNRSATDGRVVKSRWLLCLIAALVLARAVIPVGFMPNVSALADGVLEIVICSGAGIKTIALDESGAPVAPSRPHTNHVQDGLCPFATASALAAVALISALFRPYRWPSRALFSVDKIQFAPAYHSGALGPRAPPFI